MPGPRATSRSPRTSFSSRRETRRKSGRPAALGAGRVVGRANACGLDDGSIPTETLTLNFEKADEAPYRLTAELGEACAAAVAAWLDSGEPVDFLDITFGDGQNVEAMIGPHKVSDLTLERGFLVVDAAR